MRIFQHLKTFPLYISYFFRVVDLHSLQAPFVFRFYSDLIDGLNSQKAYSDIENVRMSMLKSREVISGPDLGAGSRFLNDSGTRKVASIARHGISSVKDCLLLSQLVRMKRPSVCLELGTSLGLTTAYLSRAMGKGLIYTFEGNEDLCSIAGKNWEQLRCKNIHLVKGNIDDTLPEWLLKAGNVDFVIIDANHTADALLRYIDWIKVYLTAGGNIYIDDIRWSVEMYKAWKKAISDTQVTLSIEFVNGGLLIFKEGLPKQHYILSQ